MLARKNATNKAVWRDFLKEVKFVVTGEVADNLSNNARRVAPSTGVASPTADSASFYVLFVSLTKLRRSAHHLPEFENCLGFLVSELSGRLQRSRSTSYANAAQDLLLGAHEGITAEQDDTQESSAKRNSEFFPPHEARGSSCGAARSSSSSILQLHQERAQSLSPRSPEEQSQSSQLVQETTSGPRDEWGVISDIVFNDALKLKHLCGICGTFAKLGRRFVWGELRAQMIAITQQTTEDVCRVMALRRELQERTVVQEGSLQQEDEDAGSLLACLPHPSGQDVAYLVDAML